MNSNTLKPAQPILNDSLKLNLIYDKISFTIPIKESERMNVIKRISNNDFYPLIKQVYIDRPDKGRYKNNYEFTYNGNSISIALYPIKKTNNFVRVEYNPHKLGKDGRIVLRTFLIALLGRDVVKEIYFSARVTRLDLTMDIRGLEPHYYIHKAGVKYGKLNRDDQGQLNSQILGTGKSNCRITFYDKNVELTSKGKDTEDTPYQRLELRLRNLNCPMAELDEKLLAHFQKINLFDHSFLEDDRFSDRFKKNAYKDGFNIVFNKIYNDKRATLNRYKKYLADYQVFPISLEGISFEATHKKALGSLLHPDYRHRLTH